MLIKACKTLFLLEKISEHFSFCSHVYRDFLLVIYNYPGHNRPMYIETVPNRHSRPTILLREAWREGQHVRKRTLTNLTHWPAPKIDALRLLLQDVPLVPLHSLFVVEHSLPHGAVEAIVGTMRHLGLDGLLASKPCRERQLVLAMIAERLLHPSSKLGTTRLWHTTTLAEELGVAPANEDDLYAAMDWLLARQARIEQQLAKRHLVVGSHVLYDVTSSSYEGSTCPLARFGYNRDQKQGTTSIVYSVLTDRDGRPIAVEAYRGNTADPTTIPGQVAKLRTRFRLERVVLVGDRGTLTQTQIDYLKQSPGLGWIAALRFEASASWPPPTPLDVALVAHEPLAGRVRASFPASVWWPVPQPAGRQGAPAERLCRCSGDRPTSPPSCGECAAKTPLSQAEIGRRSGGCCTTTIWPSTLQCRLRTISCPMPAAARRRSNREAALDGIYRHPDQRARQRLSAEDTMRGYKNLALVGGSFAP
jgi:hypothetical protein